MENDTCSLPYRLVGQIFLWHIFVEKLGGSPAPCVAGDRALSRCARRNPLRGFRFLQRSTAVHTQPSESCKLSQRIFMGRSAIPRRGFHTDSCGIWGLADRVVRLCADHAQHRARVGVGGLDNRIDVSWPVRSSARITTASADVLLQ